MPETPDAPVALFIYNRPETTARVFETIRAQRPRQLFVFADGPRVRGGDQEAVVLARLATEDVDWPCDVHRDYASGNLGIKRRVESGMRTLFDDAGCDRAILLEDDCVPDASFFRFCGELLQRYEDRPDITTICGSRLTASPRQPLYSYAFSLYAFQWGWATWRRTWQRYDSTMSAWDDLRQSPWLADLLGNPHAEAYWRYQFDRTQEAGDRGDWDIAWLFSSWHEDGLSIVPAVNLVSNIGFGADATHTRDTRSVFASLPVAPMPFPLIHPPAIARSEEEDLLAASTVFSGNLERMVQALRQRIRRTE